MFKRGTIKKIIFFLIVIPVGIIISGWIYNNFVMTADTSEADGFYDLLSDHGKPSGDLVLNLGIREDDELQVVIDRLKKVMGLGNYDIHFIYHDKRKEPAYIEKMGYGVMGIAISEKITQKREQINLLTHELGHIYVWNLENSILDGYDEEKVVDTSGVFLGLGILLLNGLTDDFFVMPGEAYHTEKKFFGYLRPEQFGYLLARYCAEYGIAKEYVLPFLEPTGRKYFSIGCTDLARRGIPVTRSSRKGKGVYWCPRCGYFMRLEISDITKDLKCPECSCKIEWGKADSLDI